MCQESLDLSETTAHRALRTVKREKEITSEKLTQIERFRQKVHGMNGADTASVAGFRGDGSGGVRTVASPDPTTGCVCGDVVEAFDETLNRCEPERDLTRSMSGELGTEFASVLLRDREAGFGSELKQAVLSSVDERRSQLRVLEEALGTEKASVGAAIEAVESLDESLVTEDELLGLGFDELRQKHGSLIYLHDDCESLIQERQETLSKTTKEATEAGLRHNSLTGYLYEELQTDHPVLSTLTEAVRVCEDREHEVRKHICKAV
jgi:hypothetical protein